MSEKVAIISTSDRNVFRQCRRKWNWSSHLRYGLAPIEQAVPLWFGSGFHHALEDFHGSKNYKSHAAAFEDYYQATLAYYGEDKLPFDAQDLVINGIAMLEYYENEWLGDRGRDPLTTYKVGGIPQVEVPFEVEIPVSKSLLRDSNYDKVVYKGVIDRIVVDEYGYLWILDYKTGKSFSDRASLELDSQIGVYLWIARHLYKRPVIGFVHQQHKKRVCEDPKILKSGDLSVDRHQATSYNRFRKTLIDNYGKTENAPQKYRDFMVYLMEREDDDGDDFIRRTWITRGENSSEFESQKVVAEVEDMIDKSIRIYPNPTFLCGATCPFVEPCMDYDRGDNYDDTLENEFYVRDYSKRSSWATHLKINPNEGKEVKRTKPKPDTNPKTKKPKSKPKTKSSPKKHKKVSVK